MAHVFADLVRETTDSDGTGALLLNGTSNGFRAFSAVMANGDTAWVAIRHQVENEWEICLGTWGTGGILTRTAVIQSSNGGSAVSFSGGTKDVFLTAPADAVVAVNVANVASPASIAFVTPLLGTPTSGTLTNCDGLPLSTGVTGTLPVDNGGTGRTTSTTAYGLLAAGTTATGAHQTLAAGATTEILVGGGASALPVWTAATGSGAPVRATSPTLVTPLLGTPTSGTLTNCTGLPVSSGISGLGSGVATFLATPSSANLAAAVTGETGTGALVFADNPTLTTPTLGVATATSVNKVAITAPASSATLTIANGKTLTASNTLTLTATDGSTLAVGAGGTLGTGAFNAHIGYSLMVNGILALDPADSTTYYYGAFIPTTTAGFNKIYVPKAGTVKIIYVFITNVGTLGSSETSTISFRLNNTTDTTVSSAVTTNATVQTFSNTGLSVSVAAGDYFEFKWVSPAYATNPTQIRFFTQVYIE